MTNLIGKVESKEMDREELTAHASTLVLVFHVISMWLRLLTLRYRIAGGETVATFLAAATFYLLRDPVSYEKLKDEIRRKFKTYKEIDHVSAQALPYLQAVISEGLRIYPPGSQGFPRVSPGVSIDGVWVPAGVCNPMPNMPHAKLIGTADGSLYKCMDSDTR